MPVHHGQFIKQLCKFASRTCLGAGLLAALGTYGGLESNPVYGQQTFDSGPVNLAIPDANPAGVTTSIMVPAGTGILTDVDVLLDIQHTFVGDLIFRVTSPEGTTVTLLDQLSGGADGEDLIGSYLFDDESLNTVPTSPGIFNPPIPPGDYQSEELLSAFDGEIADGDWTLFISDNTGADLGTLNFWQLILTASPTGGEIFGTAAQANVQNTNLQYRMLRDQVSTAFRDSQGGNGFAFTYPLEPAQEQTPMQLTRFNNEDLIVRGQCCTDSTYGMNGWVAGYGLGGQLQPKGGSGSLNYSAAGGQFGLHQYRGCDTMTGLFGGYNHQDVRVSTNNSSSDIDSGVLGGFIRHGCDQYLLLAGSLGYDDYETIRGTAAGDTEGIQGSVFLEGGRTRRLGRVDVTPNAALQYVGLYQNSFTETGIGATNVSGIGTHSLRSLIGVDVDTRQRQTDFGLVSFEASGHWMHEYLDTNSSVTTGVGGTNFISKGLDFGREWAIIGTGLRLQRSAQLSFFADYDLQINSRQEFHTASGGMLYQF